MRLEKANKNKPLSPQDESDLWDRVEKGDKKVLEKIIAPCLKYVYGRCLKYIGNKSINVFELMGEGHLALVKASQKYNRTKGARFYSYAQYVVDGAIGKKVEDSSKLKLSDNVDIDCLKDNDEIAFSADDISWREKLPNRIQDYLDKRYYPGAGSLFLHTIQLTTEGFSLQEAAAKQNVEPKFIRRMKREVRAHFNHSIRVAA